MTKKTGVTLMAVGLGAQAVDVLTAKDASGGVLFGDTGILRGVDQAVPKVTIPGLGVQTNIAFWVILLGFIVWLIRR